MEWQYTPDEIYYKLGGMATLANDQLDHLLAVALSMVPKAVADSVCNDCLILSTFDHCDAFFVPRTVLQAQLEGGCKGVIVISDDVLRNRSKEGVFRAILHEIAHFHCGHLSPLFDSLTDEQAAQQEEEADRLASEWMANSEKGA